MILSIALVLLFMIGAVSAANETDAIIGEPISDEVISEDVSQINVSQEDVGETPDSNDVISEDASQEEVLKETTGSTKITAIIKSDDTNIIKGKEFSVQLTDANSTPLVGKTVKIKVNKVITPVKTDSNGIAKLKINLNPGTYTVKYLFEGDGYTRPVNYTDILVLSTSTSKIKGSDYVAYIGAKNKYTVVLKAGKTPLAKRIVVFNINGKNITKKTNSNGKASINIDEAKGTYKISYTYAGEKNIKKCSGTSKITVKKGMPIKFKTNSAVYKHKKVGYFKVKLTDAHGDVLAHKKVIFKIKGKKYTRKTNGKGIASLKIKLREGTYKIKVGYKKDAVYKKTVKTYKIVVNPIKNNGMWLFAYDMKSVNFNKLDKHGITHIFLNFYCFHKFGKSYVKSWIKKANSHHLKVHIWMQVCYGDNGWELLSNHGKINYGLINAKVKEAKKYAKIKGVAGVHFDYIRYPGNAYQHGGAVKAVNFFIKKSTKAIHKVNKKLIVSAAVMPEPSGMKYYYAQDIKTMGKYLDAIVPMVYKGNYHAGSKWITSVTKTFAKQSKAEIWTGLQSYRSDSNVNKIPAKELKNDAKASYKGGANGVILFRYGLFNFFNFNKV